MVTGRLLAGRLPTAGRRYLGGLAVALFFLGCSLFMFQDSLRDGRLFWQADTILFYYPIATRVKQVLDAGRFPLWTPYIFGGHPLLADGEAGMLYPFHLLIWWLFQAQDAFIIMRVVRFWLAGWFMYGFLRALHIGRTGALVGGLVYGFGSFMVGQLHHANVGASIAWVPLILRYLELGLQTTGRRRVLNVTLAGTALGLQALTIHINVMLMTGIVLASYMAFRCLLGPVAGLLTAGAGRRAGLGIVMLGAAAAIGIGLSAVQVFPLLELAQLSPRYAGVDYRFATSFALPPANLMTLVFPYFFRDVQAAYWSPWFRWDTTVYAGVVALILAFFALTRVRSRLTVFFALLALLGLFLAMGDYLPVKPYALLWRLPVFSMTRVPSRFIFFAVFGLAVLAAQGADWLAAALAPGAVAPPAPRRVRTILLVIVLLAAGAGVLAFLFQSASDWIAAHPAATLTLLDRWYPRGWQNPLTDRAAQDAVAALRFSLTPSSVWTARSLLWVALAAGLLGLWYWLRLLRPLWQCALVLLVACDLLTFARDFHPRLSQADLAPRSRVLEFLKDNNGVQRVYVAWPVTLIGPNRLLPYQIADAGGYSSLVTQRYNEWVTAMQRMPQRFLDMMNVRYVVAAPQSAQNQLDGGRKIFEEGNIAVYERSPQPRAYVVNDVQLAGTAEDALRLLSAPAFDAKRTAVLENVSAATIKRNLEPEPTEATVVRYTSDEVIVRTDAGQAGYLVLADTFYPGWRAELDGKSATIVRANYLFRAVKVPKGEHVVRFYFRPLSVMLGALLSLVTVLGIVVVALSSVFTRYSWPSTRKRGRDLNVP